MPLTYQAGTELQVVLPFFTPNSTPGGPPVATDPSSFVFVFQLGGGTVTTWNWPTGSGSGNFTHFATGVVIASLDTTLGAGDNGGATIGNCTIRVTSLGACAVTSFIQFSLVSPPI